VTGAAVPDLGYKFVVALKDGLPAGVALNAAAHLALGLREKAQACPDLVERMAFIAYEDAAGGRHEPISALSLVVLTGRPSHLRRLRAEAAEAGLLHVDFTATMTGDTYAEQLERTKATAEEELDYYGVALFGSRDVVDPLTRRLSLWR